MAVRVSVQWCFRTAMFSTGERRRLNRSTVSAALFLKTFDSSAVSRCAGTSAIVAGHGCPNLQKESDVVSFSRSKSHLAPGDKFSAFSRKALNTFTGAAYTGFACLSDGTRPTGNRATLPGLATHEGIRIGDRSIPNLFRGQVSSFPQLVKKRTGEVSKIHLLCPTLTTGASVDSEPFVTPHLRSYAHPYRGKWGGSIYSGLRGIR